MSLDCERTHRKPTQALREHGSPPTKAPSWPGFRARDLLGSTNHAVTMLPPSADVSIRIMGEGASFTRIDYRLSWRQLFCLSFHFPQIFHLYLPPGRFLNIQQCIDSLHLQQLVQLCGWCLEVVQSPPLPTLVCLRHQHTFTSWCSNEEAGSH